MKARARTFRGGFCLKEAGGASCHIEFRTFFSFSHSEKSWETRYGASNTIFVVLSGERNVRLLLVTTIIVTRSN
jgi:hypothetical protein